MSALPQKKEFLEGKKTYIGLGLAYAGFELIPVFAQIFGELGTSLGGSIGEGLTRAGLVFAAIGKVAADARARVLAAQITLK